MMCALLNLYNLKYYSCLVFSFPQKNLILEILILLFLTKSQAIMTKVPQAYDVITFRHILLCFNGPLTFSQINSGF